MAKKFVSVNIDNKSIYGIETNNGVIELSKKFPEWTSLLEVCLLYTSPSPRD